MCMCAYRLYGMFYEYENPYIMKCSYLFCLFLCICMRPKSVCAFNSFVWLFHLLLQYIYIAHDQLINNCVAAKIMYT